MNKDALEINEELENISSGRSQRTPTGYDCYIGPRGYFEFDGYCALAGESCYNYDVCKNPAKDTGK